MPVALAPIASNTGMSLTGTTRRLRQRNGMSAIWAKADFRQHALK